MISGPRPDKLLHQPGHCIERRVATAKGGPDLIGNEQPEMVGRERAPNPNLGGGASQFLRKMFEG